MANVTKKGEKVKVNLTYFSIDPESYLMPEVIEGESTLNRNEIILNNTLKEEGFEIRDTLVDATSEIEFTIVVFTKNQFYGHTSLGVINLETYQNLLKVSTGRDEVSFQAIALEVEENEENQLALEKFISENLNDRTLVTSSEVISNIPGRAAEQATLIMMLVFLLIISALIIAVFFYVMTMQKIPQFGVLKALGAKMSTLSLSLAYQVLILSLIGIVIGNILTFATASVLPSSMPFVLSIKDAIMVSILFLVISVASSLFSIKKVKKVDAVSAIGGTY